MNTLKKTSLTGLALAAVLGGGAIMASALPASAADVSSSGSTSSSTSSATAADPTKGGHQHNGITETLLTGDTATQVTAAVQAAYPDATIQRVETDAEGATYEAHIVQADGTSATVKLDASFAITGTETGGPGGGHGGHHGGTSDGSTDGSTSGSTDGSTSGSTDSSTSGTSS